MSYGFCCSEFLLLSPADQTKTLTGIKAAGATYVRISVPWSFIEPTQGTWVWGPLTAAIKAIIAAGLKPLLVLEHPKPQAGFWVFASDAPWATPAEYGVFCAAVVRQFPQVTDFELWNEPNLAGFWNPIDPVAFAPYVKAGYDAAKQIAQKSSAPGTQIALGGLAAAIDGSGFSWWPFGYFKTSADTVKYLTALYTAGCGGHFDAVGYHPYVGDPYTFKALEPQPSAPSITGISALRDVMAKNGDGAKDIWPTEWGFSTNTGVTGVTPAIQAQWLVEQWHSMAAYPLLSHSCIFSWRNMVLPGAAPNPADGQSNYGVVDANYLAKPALAALMGVVK